MSLLAQRIPYLESSLLELRSLVASEVEENPLLEETESGLQKSPESREQPGPALEHLAEQLRLVSSDPNTLAIGETLIGNLDDDGYLRLDLAEAAELTGTAVERVEQVLRLIHTFDPAGIGARTLRECLLLQLGSLEDPDPVAVEIVTGHLEALGRHQYRQISRALHVPRRRVLKACDEIRRLEPKPGRFRSTISPGGIIADVVVEKINGVYCVTPGDAWPRLRIRTDLDRAVAGTDEAVLAYVRAKRRRAHHLVKTIDRKRTLLCRLVEHLSERRRAFLEGEAEHILQVALWQVAREMGVTDHLLEQVTMRAYVQTPRGLFRLRDFFLPGTGRREGGRWDGPTTPAPRPGGRPPRRPAGALALPVPEPEREPAPMPRILRNLRRMVPLRQERGIT